jgi:hypothetical protein
MAAAAYSPPAAGPTARCSFGALERVSCFIRPLRTVRRPAASRRGRRYQICQAASRAMRDSLLSQSPPTWQRSANAMTSLTRVLVLTAVARAPPAQVAPDSIAPRPCIRWVHDPNHDALMRIGGEAPRRRTHSFSRRVKVWPGKGGVRRKVGATASSLGAQACQQAEQPCWRGWRR